MKYLCLIYPEDAALDSLSERDYAAIIEEVLAFREELRLSGHYIASSPLQPAEVTTTCAGPERQGFDHGWSLRRNEGAAGGLLSHRSDRLE